MRDENSLEEEEELILPTIKSKRDISSKRRVSSSNLTTIEGNQSFLISFFVTPRINLKYINATSEWCRLICRVIPFLATLTNHCCKSICCHLFSSVRDLPKIRLLSVVIDGESEISSHFSNGYEIVLSGYYFSKFHQETRFNDEALIFEFIGVLIRQCALILGKRNDAPEWFHSGLCELVRHQCGYSYTVWDKPSPKDKDYSAGGIITARFFAWIQDKYLGGSKFIYLSNLMLDEKWSDQTNPVKILTDGSILNAWKRYCNDSEYKMSFYKPSFLLSKE